MKEIQTTWIQIVALIQFTQNIIKKPDHCSSESAADFFKEHWGNSEQIGSSAMW